MTSVPITPVMWLVARVRRQQGRTGVRPVSHRPSEVALRQSMARHPAGKHRRAS